LSGPHCSAGVPPAVFHNARKIFHAG